MATHFQCSCLENPRDGGAWWAAIYRVAQSQIRLKRLSSCSSMHCSVQFSRSVISDSLWLHGLQHARLPCWSSTPRVYSNSCPSSQWCHPTNLPCHPLLLLPSIFPSIFYNGSFPRVFSNQSVLHTRWRKYWSFSFSISLSSEYLGVISFRMDWFDLLAAKGTLKGLLQYHNSKTSILQHSAFFIVQLSHPYMTTGKNHHLD